MHFSARNVNEMAYIAYMAFISQGYNQQSREGLTLRFIEPTTLTYTHPWECVCTIKDRKINPWLHLFESVWLLAGTEKIDFITTYCKALLKYSDDGENMYGAYSHRISNQLSKAIHILEDDIHSRRAVVMLWDKETDLYWPTTSKDVPPCNLGFALSYIEPLNCLDMVVFNRSNDAIFGNITGVNPPVFATLLVYAAQKLGIRAGRLHFCTSNLHVYINDDIKELWSNLKKVDMTCDWYSLYVPKAESKPRDMGDGVVSDCRRFVRQKEYLSPHVYALQDYDSKWFQELIIPMNRVWWYMKNPETKANYLHAAINDIKYPDWQCAVRQYLSSTRFAL